MHQVQSRASSTVPYWAQYIFSFTSCVSKKKKVIRAALGTEIILLCPVWMAEYLRDSRRLLRKTRVSWQSLRIAIFVWMSIRQIVIPIASLQSHGFDSHFQRYHTSIIKIPEIASKQLQPYTLPVRQHLGFPLRATHIALSLLSKKQNL